MVRLKTTANRQQVSYTIIAALAVGMGFADARASFAGGVSLSFEGISQYDSASLGRDVIPPDTNGAVGRSQYVELTKGAYAVFDKTTGSRQLLQSDVSFWTAAGQTGTSGDPRVMYNAAANRWIVTSFAANAKDVQIAISDTDNALGTWKSTKFEGYPGLGFGGANADFPTLALDRNAVYIGTNNFATNSLGVNGFQGTTLNVIPIDSLFSATAPTTTNSIQFTTPFDALSATNGDLGFAQQGVNSKSTGSTGKVLSASIYASDNLGFKVNGLSTTSATGAVLTTPVLAGLAALTTAGAASQPSVAIPANQRIIDAGDRRIGSSVYEVGGRIYAVNTVDSIADGRDEARIRYSVLDANTLALLAQGDIGEAGYDYYYGSIGVNEAGKVVIGYNRSGLDVATGNISFLARTFDTGADGSLIQTGSELLLKTSLTDDYHNVSAFGEVFSGRQRWGDYSSVSLDPDDPNKFYAIGQFAREYDLPEFGQPGGTGASRWGTWIAAIDVSTPATSVPEPLSVVGTLLGGSAAVRLRRRLKANNNL
jgi:hypothetical protein